MPRRTRLFQQAGSPLIQGRSRAVAPFWKEWLAATAVAWAVGVAELWLFGPRDGGPPLSVNAFVWLIVDVWPYGLGAAAVCAVAVWLGGRMGWRRRWLAAGVAGLVAANVTVLVAMPWTR